MSAEWFAPVDRFTVLSLPPQSSSSVPVALTQQLAQRAQRRRRRGTRAGQRDRRLRRFRTDFSASVGDTSVNIAVSDWNLYHLSTGVSFHLGDSQFTLGITGSFGGSTGPPLLPIPPEGLPATGLDSEVNTRYRKLVFLLGFLFGS